ncbi:MULTISPECIES: hypothetical protein [Myxococcus]|uniref:hypothetical protein n=1 Tax=Myxococcus TaxID=32 RepID=UPI0015950545|nr:MULTISPECIES: hypothetical protein [Myxococcus]NVJ20276.1 hypothetical protein [Myxococcus sp. AM011]
MGLFGSFNPLKLIQKPLELLGKAAETVSKLAGGVANIGGKVLDFLKKPAEEVISPITDKISEQIKKIPFLGKFLAPVVENLMKQGVTSLVGEGPIGGIGALAKATSKIEDVVKVAETVRKGADKVDAFADNFLGQQNLQNIFAQRHASFIE